MKKIFLDTNILIDIVAERKEITTNLKELLVQFQHSQFFLSTLSVPIIYYVFKIKKGSKFDQKIQDFVNIINLISLDGSFIELAFDNYTSDFEDTLQYYSALSENCNYILTRDIKDFEKIKQNIPSDIEIINTLKDIV
jgi:predicted nucleic acid-binding protein